MNNQNFPKLISNYVFTDRKGRLLMISNRHHSSIS